MTQDVISLVSENPAAHGVFDQVDETQKQVYCDVRSVGRNEYYLAKSAGLEPEIVFVLSERADYSGEKVVIWRENRYRVVRTYSDGPSIELTCEVATDDR